MINVQRTEYAGGIPQRWIVSQDQGPRTAFHLTYHHDVDDALLMVKVLMEQVLEDEKVQP